MKIKLLTFLFTAALLLPALSVKGQPVPSFNAQIVPLPATLAAATTTNFASPLWIDASKAQNVAFMFGNSWSTAGESTGSTNVLYTLAPSVDGSHYDTNKTVTLASYNRSGTAGQTTYSSTNLSANGIKGWYVIKAVNNSAGGVVTNGASDCFIYSIKIGAP